SEFFQDARMKHRGGRRRGTITERSPGMKRPERDKNAEPEQKHREDELLSVHVHRVFCEIAGQFSDVESALVGGQLQVDRNQSEQCNQGTQAEVDRDLEGRVVLVFTASP